MCVVLRLAICISWILEEGHKLNQINHQDEGGFPQPVQSEATLLVHHAVKMELNLNCLPHDRGLKDFVERILLS
jgi:hypothetical protein